MKRKGKNKRGEKHARRVCSFQKKKRRKNVQKAVKIIGVLYA